MKRTPLESFRWERERESLCEMARAHQHPSKHACDPGPELTGMGNLNLRWRFPVMNLGNRRAILGLDDGSRGDLVSRGERRKID